MWREGLGEKILEQEKREAEKELEEEVIRGRWGLILRFLGGIAVTIISARLVVSSALDLTALLGLPMETIGATVIALGTGLPELSLELNSIKRGEYQLALGDIFGSTLTNATLILGVLTILSTGKILLLPFVGVFPFFFLALGVVYYSLFLDDGLGRKWPLILIGIYAVYIIIEIELFGLLL